MAEPPDQHEQAEDKGGYRQQGDEEEDDAMRQAHWLIPIRVGITDSGDSTGTLSAIGYRLSAIGYRLSAIGYWLLGALAHR
jgi:hypothetical protein